MSNIAKIRLDAIKSLLLCQKCNKADTSLFTTECHHSFCSQCTNNLREEKTIKSLSQCPFCWRPIRSEIVKNAARSKISEIIFDVEKSQLNQKFVKIEIEDMPIVFEDQKHNMRITMTSLRREGGSIVNTGQIECGSIVNTGQIECGSNVSTRQIEDCPRKPTCCQHVCSKIFLEKSVMTDRNSAINEVLTNKIVKKSNERSIIDTEESSDYDENETSDNELNLQMVEQNKMYVSGLVCGNKQSYLTKIAASKVLHRCKDWVILRNKRRRRTLLQRKYPNGHCISSDKNAVIPSVKHESEISVQVNQQEILTAPLYTIIGVSFTKTENDILYQFGKKFQVKIESKLTPNVNCIVVNKNRAIGRQYSLSLLYGIAKDVEIVDSSWVEESIKSQNLFDPHLYPCTASILPQQRGNCSFLFSNFVFAIVEKPNCRSSISFSCLKVLIETCGSTLYTIQDFPSSGETQGCHRVILNNQHPFSQTSARGYRSSPCQVAMFKSEIDELTLMLKCKICHNIAVNCTTTECGHSFCTSCINRVADLPQDNCCPACRKVVDKKKLQCNKARSQIAVLFLRLQSSFAQSDYCEEMDSSTTKENVNSPKEGDNVVSSKKTKKQATYPSLKDKKRWAVDREADLKENKINPVNFKTSAKTMNNTSATEDHMTASQKFELLLKEAPITRDKKKLFASPKDGSVIYYERDSDDDCVIFSNSPLTERKQFRCETRPKKSLKIPLEVNKPLESCNNSEGMININLDDSTKELLASKNALISNSKTLDSSQELKVPEEKKTECDNEKKAGENKLHNISDGERNPFKELCTTNIDNSLDQISIQVNAQDQRTHIDTFTSPLSSEKISNIDMKEQNSSCNEKTTVSYNSVVEGIVINITLTLPKRKLGEDACLQHDCPAKRIKISTDKSTMTEPIPLLSPFKKRIESSNLPQVLNSVCDSRSLGNEIFATSSPEKDNCKESKSFIGPSKTTSQNRMLKTSFSACKSLGFDGHFPEQTSESFELPCGQNQQSNQPNDKYVSEIMSPDVIDSEILDVYDENKKNTNEQSIKGVSEKEQMTKNSNASISNDFQNSVTKFSPDSKCNLDNCGVLDSQKEAEVMNSPKICNKTMESRNNAPVDINSLPKGSPIKNKVSDTIGDEDEDDLFIPESPAQDQTQRLVIIGTGFQKNEAVLQEFTHKLNASFVDCLSHEVNCVVVNEENCDITLKVMFGIVRNCVFVKRQWVEDSLKAGAILSTDSYLCYKHLSPADQQLQWPFLGSFVFSFVQLGSLEENDVKVLIEACGSTFYPLEKFPPPTSTVGRLRMILNYGSTLTPAEINDITTKHQAPIVDFNFIFQSIFEREVTTVSPHVLSTTEKELLLLQLGYPHHLIFNVDDNSNEESLDS